MKTITLLFIFLTLCVSCSNNDLKDKVEFALSNAGKNQKELELVLKHYSKYAKDSLKLKSAKFLIANMVGKGYYKLSQKTEFGKVVDFNLFNKNYRFVNGVDSINIMKKQYEDSTKCGTIYYDNPIFIADLQAINHKFLIENIDYAFKAWQMPWAQKLTFDEFKEYILPYRFGTEPLENWRKKFFMENAWLYSDGDEDRLSLASKLNDSLSKIYKWYGNEHYPYYPSLLSPSQVGLFKCGRCDDLNMLVAYSLRAIGVPVASEFTPLWGNSNYGGHSWVSILDTARKFVPMNAIFDNPVKGSLPFKGARLTKAFRNKFELNPDFYSDYKNFTQYVDITKEYIPVVNYTITSNHKEEVFLGILNGLYWNPISTKKTVKKSVVTFENIGREILYAPIIIKNVGGFIRSKPIGRPFVVNKAGKIICVLTDTTHKANLKIDIAKYFLPKYKGKTLQVIYWDNQKNDWIYTKSKSVLKEDPALLKKQKQTILLEFKGVPANAIYRIVDSRVPLNNTSGERPFVVLSNIAKSY